MSDAASDLVSHLQRRSLLEQQQRMARAGYAYGVDLRRAYWLGTSSLTRPLVGAADRRWAELTSRLQREVLLPPERMPASLLEEVAQAAATLRAPVPTVRMLTSAAATEARWPAATPLGTTHGSVTWLILDPECVGGLSPAARRFTLTAAVAHLQCDHGTLFTLHLLTRGRPRAARTVRRVLAPWSKVAVFSADRAGLFAAVDLEVATHTIEDEDRHDREIPWWPAFPGAKVRAQALRDFDHSAIMARARRLRARKGGEPEPEADAQTDEGAAPDGSIPGGDLGVPSGPGWSLARCDARLTRRLGLL